METGINSNAVLKLVVLILVLFMLPLDVDVLNGYAVYHSVLCVAGSGSAMEMETNTEGVVLVPPAIILLAVAESLPGAFFFLRIHGPSRSGRIRGLFAGSVAAALTFAALLPNLWFLRVQLGSPFFFEFDYVAIRYPTIAVVGLIFVPFLFRESSFLLLGNSMQQQNKSSTILSTRAASSWISNCIALVTGFITFIVPTTFSSWSYPNWSRMDLSSTVAIIFSQHLSYTSSVESEVSCSILMFDAFAAMLILSSIRVLFAEKLILYYRGFGQTRRVLATGLIGESVADGPAMISYVSSIGVAPGVLMIPLPFLLILGVLLVMLRDKLTARTAVEAPREETSGAEVWPVTFEEEGAVPSSELNVRPPPVEVSVIHRMLSRIRNRCLGSDK